MTPLAITVNGRPVSANVEPRTHLADFLRESLLLTGTHLGCEQGVCGACTILLNDEPVRSCINFAALCNGTSIHTIEGLTDDPAITALRAAFTAEHALQCGYCTPGMLITARDIVLRLPHADDDRIRLELAGNLCRCTGYNGIVKAIRLVLDAGSAAPAVKPKPIPTAQPIPTSQPPTSQPITATASPPPTPSGAGLTQSLRIGLPAEVVWTAIQDPAFVAGCVPGATVTSIENGRIEGEMLASLGPIQAKFAGQATVTFDQETREGSIAGAASDKASGTRLSAETKFALRPDGDNTTTIRLDITYALRGALAQFSRGPIVKVFAAEIANTIAANLEARLRGQTLPNARLPTGRLFIRALWNLLRQFVTRRDV
jgi:carbon-monoxide dehydrogenase small subunit